MKTFTDSPIISKLFNVMLILVMAGASAGLTYILLTRLGNTNFLFAMVGLIVLMLLFKISVRDLSVALMLWLLFATGLKYAAIVRMPGLPDFSFDRLLLVWIVLMFLLQLTMKRVKLSPPFTLDALVIIHTIYILLLITFTAPRYFNAWIVSSLSPMFGYLYGKHVINEEHHIRNLLFFLLFVSVFFYYLAIVEHFGWNSLVWPKEILDSSIGLWQPGRSRGPVLHPPLFGQLQAMALLVYFYFLARKVSSGVRFFLSISFGLSMVGLLFAYTRGPWFAAAAAFVVLGILRPNYRKILMVLAVLGALFGTLGLFELANSDFLQERINASGTFEDRLGFIITSIRIIADHPVFGVGYFNAINYVFIYSQGAYVPLYGYIKKAAGEDIVPHDIYIGRSADEGLFSTGLLLIMGLIVFRAFVVKWRMNPQGKWFNRDSMAILGAIMVCYLVGGMVIDYRYFDLVNVLMYLMMGIIYGYKVEPQRSLHDQQAIWAKESSGPGANKHRSGLLTGKNDSAG